MNNIQQPSPNWTWKDFNPNSTEIPFSNDFNNAFIQLMLRNDANPLKLSKTSDNVKYGLKVELDKKVDKSIPFNEIQHDQVLECVLHRLHQRNDDGKIENIMMNSVADLVTRDAKGKKEYTKSYIEECDDILSNLPFSDYDLGGVLYSHNTTQGGQPPVFRPLHVPVLVKAKSPGIDLNSFNSAKSKLFDAYVAIIFGERVISVNVGLNKGARKIFNGVHIIKGYYSPIGIMAD